jgi:uncharacterized protein
LTIDDKTQTELEAAVFRRLVDHLRSRTDVQNIAMTKDASREAVYGMPYDEWKAKHQREATGDQAAAFEKTAHNH